MEVQTVMQHIKTQKPLNFYVFTGDEWQVQKIYIQKLAECKNCKPQYIDSIKDIYAKLRNTSFISNVACYVVRDDSEILTNEQLQGQIKANLFKDNIFILLLTNLDKRLKFYKLFKDSIVEFEPLKEDILIKYIKKEIDLSDKNCQMLIDICKQDYGRILLEIDKIRRYADANVSM